MRCGPIPIWSFWRNPSPGPLTRKEIFFKPLTVQKEGGRPLDYEVSSIYNFFGNKMTFCADREAIFEFDTKRH